MQTKVIAFQLKENSTEQQHKYAVQLYFEADRIVEGGFLCPNEARPFYFSPKREEIEKLLKEKLENHPDKKALEKFLVIHETKIDRDSPYYRYLVVKGYLLKEDTSSTSCLFYSIKTRDEEAFKLLPKDFDKWAWEKAKGLGSFYDNSDIDNLMKKKGIDIKEKGRIEKFIRSKRIEDGPTQGTMIYSCAGLKQLIVENLIRPQTFELSPSMYQKLSTQEKNQLELEFQQIIAAYECTYLLNNDEHIAELAEAAKDLKSKTNPNNRLVCLGRTPYYLFFTLMAINKLNFSLFDGKSDNFVQVSFTGTVNKSHENKQKIAYYRQYLEMLHLTPDEIISKHQHPTMSGKTIIVDYLDTEQGIESFTQILTDWALEKGGKEKLILLQNALEIYSLNSIRGSNYTNPLSGRINGINVKIISEKNFLFYSLANGNVLGFNDGIKSPYLLDDWGKYFPTTNEITYNGYLVSAHILNVLSKNNNPK